MIDDWTGPSRRPSAPDIIAIAAKGLGQSEAVIRLGLTYFDPEIRVSASDIQASLDSPLKCALPNFPVTNGFSAFDSADSKSSCPRSRVCSRAELA